jgi:hypothetical protein
VDLRRGTKNRERSWFESAECLGFEREREGKVCDIISVEKRKGENREGFSFTKNSMKIKQGN